MLLWSVCSIASPRAYARVQVSKETDHRPPLQQLHQLSRQPTIAAPSPRWVPRCVTYVRPPRPQISLPPATARIAHTYARTATVRPRRAPRGSRFPPTDPAVRRPHVSVPIRPGRDGHDDCMGGGGGDGRFLVPHACAQRSRWRSQADIRPSPVGLF
jgi:hypothetical protein